MYFQLLKIKIAFEGQKSKKMHKFYNETYETMSSIKVSTVRTCHFSFFDKLKCLFVIIKGHLTLVILRCYKLNSFYSISFYLNEKYPCKKFAKPNKTIATPTIRNSRKISIIGRSTATADFFILTLCTTMPPIIRRYSS